MSVVVSSEQILCIKQRKGEPTSNILRCNQFIWYPKKHCDRNQQRTYSIDFGPIHKAMTNWRKRGVVGVDSNYIFVMIRIISRRLKDRSCVQSKGSYSPRRMACFEAKKRSRLSWSEWAVKRKSLYEMKVHCLFRVLIQQLTISTIYEGWNESRRWKKKRENLSFSDETK